MSVLRSIGAGVAGFCCYAPPRYNLAFSTMFSLHSWHHDNYRFHLVSLSNVPSHPPVTC
jgi:hypothetical protein